ncbi:efflux RND transporter permease subunit, partial [Photobacterium sanctipauli]|uniref:efflux RND transporter permease subunit n=1 Tax=Photobacterium sanctipauli TaxID=1342794 RepID=UPI000569156D
DIKRQQAARYGLSIQAIQQVISTAIGGMNVSESVEGLERYPINVRYPQNYRDSLVKLQNLPLITPNGASIALADVADIRFEDGPPMIKTENARPNGWVFIDIDNRDLGSYVKEAQQVVADQLALPAGYSITWSGQYEYMERAKARLNVVVPATLAIIMMLLYMSFRRVGEVLVIMSTLPLAMVGGIWLMEVLGYNFSIAVGVGFIALAGVAVEIGVIMLVYLNQAWRFKHQESQHLKQPLTKAHLDSAIEEGAGLRVRPIMMTVATVIIGLIPIMYGSGTGSEVMQRIAAPMIGGMSSALLLTLVVIPAGFKLWKTHSEKLND